MMNWGVYSHDCYGLSWDEANRFLIQTFEDYNDALTEAEKIGKNTAIHLTPHQKNHKKELEENTQK